MRAESAAMLWLTIGVPVFGQTYTISTVAGGALPVNIPGTSANLGIGRPQDLTADAAGNLFFADQNSILRWDAATGILTLVAGDGTTDFGGDNGPPASAKLNVPRGLAVDANGNLFIADSGNNRIREISNGVITTVAGNGTAGFGGDGGAATSAQLNNPTCVAVDANGNLYIADTKNNRIREASNGQIMTVAGNGTAGFGGDGGPSGSAQLNNPGGIAVDSAGNFYIADTNNNRVRTVTNGVITTVAGDGQPGFIGDGIPGTNTRVVPNSVAVGSAGNLYIADGYNSRIRKVSNEIITTVAGNGRFSFSGDNGPATGAQLAYPTGVAVDPSGNLYIADYGNLRIRKVSNGVITTAIGGGTPLGDNGPATSAQVNPQGIAVDSADNLYIADSFNNSVVRKVANGVISTVAGNGTAGFSGDGGPATSAQLWGPQGVALDSSGN